MKQLIDRTKWNREDVFQYFLNFACPMFTVTTEIEVTGTYRYNKENGGKSATGGFFLLSLHRLMTALNSIENFRYRIENNDVYLYDVTHTGPTIARPDGTFAFSCLYYYPEYEKFRCEATKRIAELKAGKGLMLTPDNYRPDISYFTTIPWFSHTDVFQPFKGGKGYGAPSIVTSKLKKTADRVLMPVSLTAHHSLADGYHAGLFFKKAEELLNKKSII